MEQLIDRFIKAPLGVKVGGLAALVLVITALTFFLSVKPTEDKIQQRQRNLSTLMSQLAEKEEIAQNLNERRREMAELERKLAEALTELPEERDIEELLAQLNEIGKKSGLEISSVTPQSEVPEQFYARIPVKMTVTGNYHEIAMFLQETANMRRIVNVTDLRLTSPKVQNDTVVLNGDFTATTFRFLAEPAGSTNKGRTR